MARNQTNLEFGVVTKNTDTQTINKPITYKNQQKFMHDAYFFACT